MKNASCANTTARSIVPPLWNEAIGVASDQAVGRRIVRASVGPAERIGEKKVGCSVVELESGKLGAVSLGELRSRKATVCEAKSS